MGSIAINAWFWSNKMVGLGYYTRNLVAALNREVILIAPHPIPGFNVHIVRGPRLWFEQVGFPVACVKLGVQLAHVPYYGSAIIPRVPTIVTVHDLIPMVYPPYRRRPLYVVYAALIAQALPKADNLIAISHHTQSDLRNHLGLESTVVLSAPAPHFKPTPPHPDLPAQYILYVGGYDQRKNIPFLLKAYAQLPASERTRFPLILVGNPPQTIRRMIPRLGIGETVHILGFIPDEDLSAVYSGATVAVYPSLYEGFGLPILEAMSCGTPVIASNTSSLPEVVGEAGLLLDPHNQKLWAQTIQHLCNSQADRDRYREIGLAHAAGFSWERVARETEAIYDRYV